VEYKWLDHVVIVVNDVRQATRDYERLLGIEAEDDRGFRHAVFRLGASKRFLELCEPTDSSKQAGGAMRRRLDRLGEGIHTVAVAVDDVDAALRATRERGIDVIDSAHSRSFFLHPKLTHGVLLQILQR
jgi:catechol 2,3-dioxygenase-like lactoylglutathione lyase family enzyme